MAETPGRLRLLRGTAAQWSSTNPVLSSGEIGYDTTNNILKIGDGGTTWGALPGIGAGGAATDHGTLTGLADDDHPQYALLADAVALSSTVPLADGQSGSAGTAATAAHGDHQHPALNLGFYPIRPSADSIWFSPIGRQESGSINNFTKCPGTPIPVPRPFHMKSVGFRLQDVPDGGNWKLAIYSSDTYGFPTGAPIWTSAAQSSISVGTKTIGSLDVTIPYGMHWMFFGSYGFTTNKGVPSGALFGWGAQLMPHTPAGNSGSIHLVNFNETTGAFPTISSLSDFSMPNTSSLWGYEMLGDLS